MNNTESETPAEMPRSNFKAWSFRFLIYLIVLNVFLAYDASHGQSGFWRTTLLIGLSYLFWGLGLVFIILSHKKGEFRDYQYHVSLWGFAVFTTLWLGSLVIRWFLVMPT